MGIVQPTRQRKAAEPDELLESGAINHTMRKTCGNGAKGAHASRVQDAYHARPGRPPCQAAPCTVCIAAATLLQRTNLGTVAYVMRSMFN